MNGHGEQNRIFVLKRLTGLPAVRLILLFVLALLALLWLAPQLAYSLATPGNGPGGVGTTNGSSTLELWLRADKGVFSDSGCTTPAANGNNAGCWRDQSGNAAYATQGTTTKQPTFITGSLNGQPVIAFNGNEVDALVSGDISLDQFTIFSVFDTTTAGFVYEQGATTDSIDGSNLYSAGLDCTAYVRRNGTTSGLSLNPGWINSTPAAVTHAYGGTHGTHLVSKNGTLQAFSPCPLAGNVAMNAIDVISPVYIGARGGGNNPLTGNVAELIFFSEDLPAVQEILVENYLSSKYGIVLASNDYYDGDTPANGDFDLDVAGIGQLGGVQNTEAHAAGMIVRDIDFLQDDGDWLLFGHNVATNVNTTNDIPAGWNIDTSQRWARHFYVDVTDDTTLVDCSAPGTCSVDIVFDFSDGGMTGNPAGTATNYRLLTRAGATGTFAEIAGACVTGGTSIAGDRVTFSGVDVTCLGSNFTLGTIDVVNSPTAVSLESTAIATQPSGLLVIAACVLTLGLGSFWICLRNRPE